jgi:hypothetical protein
MLVFTSVVVSATRIMTTSTTTSNESSPQSTFIDNITEKRQTPINEQDGVLSQREKNKTGFLSIPPCAFIPKNETIDYYLTGLSIYGNGTFYAPVYLPDEAIVTKLTFYWCDYSESKNAELSLWRKDIGIGVAQGMVELHTYGNDSSNHYSMEDDIAVATINNANYSYYLELWSYPYISCNDVQIEYTYVIGGSSIDNIEGQYINEPNVLETR